MKYESTILKRLIDTYGVVGNPRYISEIIKEFIVRGKESFPNLFTYQADWLAHIDEFGLNPTYMVSYTGQSIYAPNTLEKPIKSAILKGQTLVNLAGEKREYINNDANLYGWEFMLPYNLTSGKTYLAIFDVSGTIDTSNAKVYLMDNGFNSTSGSTSSTTPTFSLGHNVIKCIATNDIHKVLRIRTTYNKKFKVSNIMVIEYQDGMENWDIPYFNGMQSVKMPVLTTVGKNLFDKTKITKDYVIYSSGELTKNIGNAVSDYIKIEKNKTYIINSHSTVAIYDVNKIFIKRLNSTNVVTASNDGYIRCNIGDYANTVDSLQIEEGSVATSYEPYKSNILSCLEPVELGSVGEVKDELNLLTQQLTQRTETRPYQEGDELNSEFVTDMTNTRYKLAQEVIKTVDLTILDQNGQNVKQLMSFNGGTHFNTTSLEGSPLPVVSVSVETDLEEILMMCSLEGNTL